MDAVDSDTEEFDMPDLDIEPVEGCREADVGGMKVATRSICTELYSLLDDPEMWRVVYKRPPEVELVYSSNLNHQNGRYCDSNAYRMSTT